MMALVMAGILSVSLNPGVSAEGEPMEAVITKNISKEANVFAPAAEFSFAVTPGSASDAADGAPAIYAGPEGGVTAGAPITSAPAAGDIGENTVTVGTSELSIDASKFTEPGIYRYVITETASDYDGMAYSTETKNFDVYVDSECSVYSYAFVNADGNGGKDDGIFENVYETNDLTLKKIVAGNQGNKNKEFTFTITASGAEGEWYYVTFGDGTTPLTLKTGEAAQITLSNEETAKIWGLSGSDSYQIEEADYSADGYVTTIGEEETRTASGSISEDLAIEVTNTKNAASPTGVIAEVSSFLIMIAAAGMLAVLFLRKRNVRND